MSFSGRLEPKRPSEAGEGWKSDFDSGEGETRSPADEPALQEGRALRGAVGEVVILSDIRSWNISKPCFGIRPVWGCD